MSNLQFAEKIELAKNQLGVITPEALQDELGSLTPDDWRKASAIYSKSSSNPDGFYIEQGEAGNVTIHNDMREARRYAEDSVLELTLQDAKQVAAVAMTSELILTATAGFSVGATIFGESSATLGAVLAGAAGAMGTAALVGGGLIGVAAAGTLAYDAYQNYSLKAQAQDEMKNSRIVTFNIPHDSQ